MAICLTNWPAISVKKSTKERFEKFGNYGESADDILNRLLDGKKR